MFNKIFLRNICYNEIFGILSDLADNLDKDQAVLASCDKIIIKKKDREKA